MYFRIHRDVECTHIEDDVIYTSKHSFFFDGKK